MGMMTVAMARAPARGARLALHPLADDRGRSKHEIKLVHTTQARERESMAVESQAKRRRSGVGGSRRAAASACRAVRQTASLSWRVGTGMGVVEENNGDICVCLSLYVYIYYGPMHTACPGPNKEKKRLPKPTGTSEGSMFKNQSLI